MKLLDIGFPRLQQIKSRYYFVALYNLTTLAMKYKIPTCLDFQLMIVRNREKRSRMNVVSKVVTTLWSEGARTGGARLPIETDHDSHIRGTP